MLKALHAAVKGLLSPSEADKPMKGSLWMSSLSLRSLSLLAASSACSLFALAFVAPAAQAQANLSFSGGNGVSPLQITLVSPVSYTITAASPGTPLFSSSTA